MNPFYQFRGISLIGYNERGFANPSTTNSRFDHLVYVDDSRRRLWFD